MSFTCPSGHSSEASDFCDLCGLRIMDAGEPGVVASPEAVAPDGPDALVPEPPQICANCGELDHSGSRFCEGCGFDLALDAVPATDPAATDPTIVGWAAVIEIGREVDHEVEPGIGGPVAPVERRVLLSVDRVRVGRRRGRTDDPPEIDLAEPPSDTCVSHEHAELLLLDGQWSIVDLGSTNGTFLNEDGAPIEPNRPAELQEGDRVHIGAWTSITIERVGPAVASGSEP